VRVGWFEIAIGATHIPRLVEGCEQDKLRQKLLFLPENLNGYFWSPVISEHVAQVESVRELVLGHDRNQSTDAVTRRRSL
jgi:hypothetical protein